MRAIGIVKQRKCGRVREQFLESEQHALAAPVLKKVIMDKRHARRGGILMPERDCLLHDATLGTQTGMDKGSGCVGRSCVGGIILTDDP